MLAGGALRVAPLLDGTPVPHPDEFNVTFWPLFVALGDPMPEVFYYPYFHTYLLALLQILRGLFVASADTTLNTWLSVQYFWHPEVAQLMARRVNACCGSVTLPSPPRVTGTAPSVRIPSTAAVMESYATATSPAAMSISPQSTTLRRSRGSKSACGGWYGRSKHDCSRMAAGARSDPIRTRWPMHSKGIPRIAALARLDVSGWLRYLITVDGVDH